MLNLRIINDKRAGIGARVHRASARLGLASVLGALTLLLIGATAAQPRTAEALSNREYLIKAAILYNFARFTEWPQATLAQRKEFRLCVLGADPFGSALDTVLGKPVQGLPVAVLRLERPDQSAECDLLYFGSTEMAQLVAAQSAIGNAPVLTVAEIPDFARSGGHIEMLTVEDRVRFGINQTGAERAGLKFSAKLLTLADPGIGAPQGQRHATPK